MQTASIEQRRQYEYERFRDYSIAQMRRDEITAAGEFLQTFNVSEVRYQRDDKGLYLDDEDGSRLYLADISSAAARKYDFHARLRPEVAWQAKRVSIENEHIAFAGAMPEDSIYVVISDCPTKELERLGRDEFGYQRARQMGFIQVFHADRSGSVTIYGHSFEQNDAAGVQAMYALFGESRDENKWTLEQPLFDRDASRIDPSDLIERMVAVYDEQLSRQHGGRWHAGRPDAERREEGNSFVEKQSDLLNAHLEKLLRINPKSEAANRLRYDFILAVRDRFEGRKQGQVVLPDREMSDAGASGRAAGETVDFCGTSISASLDKTASMGFHLETMQEWKRGDCVACLNRNVLVGGCNVCKGCEHASNLGVDLMQVRDRALRAQAKQQAAAKPLLGRRLEKRPIAKRQPERRVREVRRIVVGGVVTDIYDINTGAHLATRN